MLNEKTAVWAIGGLLVALLSGSRVNLQKLVAYEEINRQEGLRKLQEELIEFSFIIQNVFESDPEKCWSLQEFKQEIDNRMARCSVSENESVVEE